MLDLSIKDIIQTYGGNKQKIAEAAAIGALGPDGAVKALASGFEIDRIRAAAAQEQVPQQTIAQQVFPFLQNAAPMQPPMSPQGLGALPAPSQGMPPAAAPAPAPAPMQEQPPMGMAEGGYLPPYASGGGLSDLPVPDGMFDEPSNGGFNDGYAGGGLIAFAAGDEVKEAAMPSTFYGYNYADPLANLAIRDKLFGAPQTKYEEETEAEYLRRRSPEYRKSQQKKDIAQLMAEAGFGMMAGSSPYALQNIGAALIPAIGSATERAKERRAEDREIQRGLLDLEQGKNTRAAQRASQALEMQGIGIKGAEGETERRFRSTEEEKQRAYDWQKFLRNEAGENYRAGLRATAEGDPKVNMASDDVVVQGRGGRADIVVPRMRVTQRGSSQYWYQFPALGDVPINPAHGGYGLGVNNALKFAQAKGLGLGVSQTGRLQFVGRDGKARTIPDEKLRKLNEAGARFDPNTYKY